VSGTDSPECQICAENRQRQDEKKADSSRQAIHGFNSGPLQIVDAVEKIDSMGIAAALLQGHGVPIECHLDPRRGQCRPLREPVDRAIPLWVSKEGVSEEPSDVLRGGRRPRTRGRRIHLVPAVLRPHQHVGAKNRPQTTDFEPVRFWSWSARRRQWVGPNPEALVCSSVPRFQKKHQTGDHPADQWQEQGDADPSVESPSRHDLSFVQGLLASGFSAALWGEVALFRREAWAVADPSEMVRECQTRKPQGSGAAMYFSRINL
jgi:hypothetical protein